MVVFGNYQRSSHLVNCKFDQMCCTIDQVINSAVFDELCNIWTISQCTYNRVRVRIRVKARFGLGSVSELGLE